MSKVVLNQLIAPIDYAARNVNHMIAHERVRRVEELMVAHHLGFLGHTRHLLLAVGQIPYPQAGMHVQRLYLVGKRLHVREALVAPIPRPVGFVGLPAVVYNHERAVVYASAQIAQPARVADDVAVRRIAIGIVPVVEAIHGLRRQKYVAAKSTVERVHGVECLYILIFSHYDFGRIKFAPAQLHARAAAAP